MKKKLLLMIALIAITFTGMAQTVSLVGGWQGWNLDNGIPFTTTDNVHFTLTNYTIPATELKIVMNSSWSTAYGYTASPGYPTGTGNTSGPNISVPSGTYTITFNATTKAYAFTPGVNPNAVITISGSGVSGTNTMYTTDGINYKSESLTLNSGTVLFSQANTANVYGNAAFPAGTATLGGAGIVTPAGGTFNVTFNLDSKAYAFTPTVVSMIGAGSPSGSWSADAVMTSTDGIHYTYTSAIIVGGGMKFRENSKWDVQFGTPGASSATPFPSGTASLNGNDMNTVSGTYDISFNRQTLQYDFVSAFPAMGIIGDAVVGAPWDGNDIDLSTSDGITYYLNGQDFTNGEAKFRLGNAWNTTYGGTGFPTGVSANPAVNIPIIGNRYNVTFNKTTGAYAFDYVSMGLNGSAVNGWNASDADMTTTDGVNYTIMNVTLLDGELKFRQNHGWAVSYGGDGFPSGTASTNGSNIVVAPGTYNVSMNRMTGAYTFAALGLNDLNKTTFKVFPNPSNNNWNFSAVNDVIQSIQVMDISGKIIFSIKNNSNTVAVDASQLPQGLYFAKVSSANATQTIKVIRN